MVGLRKSNNVKRGSREWNPQGPECEVGVVGITMLGILYAFSDALGGILDS
jgi:hypothetical protein